MTNEEAIKDIEENILPSVGGVSLRMAIEALRNQVTQAYIKVDFSEEEVKEIVENLKHGKVICIANEYAQDETEKLKDCDERKKGKWIKDTYGNVICSECRKNRRDNRIGHIAFCNCCGAKMEGYDE